jgi:hypothetical protein
MIHEPTIAPTQDPAVGGPSPMPVDVGWLERRFGDRPELTCK